MKSTTDLSEITVFGSRGHSLMMLHGMRDYWGGRVRIRALVDDIDNGFVQEETGLPVISSAERLRQFPDVPVLVTPGSPALRAEVTARLVAEGAVLATVSCPGQAHVDEAVSYGPGCFVAHYTRVGPRVQVGEGAQVLASLVAHDVVIGAYANLNVNCSVLGHVVIGAGVNVAPLAVIGNGAPERPLTIGDGAIIGVGAVVTRDVPAGARMIGNPAMPAERWKKLNQLLDQG